MSDTSATRAKSFGFDNGTNENIFSFLKKLFVFFLKEFIILDFVNFSKRIHHR